MPEVEGGVTPGLSSPDTLVQVFRRPRQHVHPRLLAPTLQYQSLYTHSLLFVYICLGKRSGVQWDGEGGRDAWVNNLACVSLGGGVFVSGGGP